MGNHPTVQVAVIAAADTSGSVVDDRYSLKMVTTDGLQVQFELTTAAISLLQVTLGPLLDQAYDRSQREVAELDGDEG